MNEDEVTAWLHLHGINAADAKAMVMDAWQGPTGFSNTVNHVFISWDGHMFNAYEG